jgi:timeless
MMSKINFFYFEHVQGIDLKFSHRGKNKTWLEHEEEELRRLFMLNQESPQTDQDVIDWIVESIKETSRTRRGVIKKLKELGLIFKAPTKKSTAAATNRNLFIRDEDDRLCQLYDEHRLDDDCLDKIMEVFHKKRTKRAVVKRMIQLRLIADESELMPVKKSKKKVSELREFPQSEEDDAEEEEPDSESDKEEHEISVRKIQSPKVYGENSKLLSPQDDEEAETVSKKRQFLPSDSEDETTIKTSVQKKKIRRIIDSDDE